MAQIILSKSVEETKRAAAELAKLVTPGTLIALDGDLGAGKTHFVQGFAQGLGVKSPITSPTFNVMCQYDDGRMPLYHFDLYRLDDPLELEDIAFYDLVEADGVSCIEWACKFVSEIPTSAVWVSIKTCADGSRLIDASAHEPQSEALVGEWIAHQA
jgi:tRNA threonylcarbamoyladenosine biosynthesis protein TsaE